MSELKDVSEIGEDDGLDPVTRSNRDALIRHMRDEVSPMLSVLESTIRMKIQEAPFLKFFLPSFAGLVKTKHDVNAEWLRISGTPWNEVDVVNDRGDVVAVVPALLPSRIFNPAMGSKKRINPELAKLGNLQRINPNKTQYAYQAVLEESLHETIDQSEVERKNRMLGALFQHYAEYLADYAKNNNIDLKKLVQDSGVDVTAIAPQNKQAIAAPVKKENTNVQLEWDEDF